MSDIKILDCTLRDGGYCNQWKFGFKNARAIVKSLCKAKVDIIECGFLADKVQYSPETTIFNSLNEAERLVFTNEKETFCVAMINYGEYDIDKLPVCDKKGIKGIRLAFHKKDCSKAMDVCRKIIEKGYLLFIQPMVSLEYSDLEFLQLILCCNQLNPYAFYIVDSFGTMNKKDLVRFYYLAEHNLRENSAIGFHSHNNMQLAYANAQVLTDLYSKHDLIIDCSIYGMGRGAGNLNTELFINYLNGNFGKNYYVHPIISIIDRVIDIYYKENCWGYSFPNYLSATYNVHPNYTGYLCDKNTLNMEDIDAIFNMMEEEKRINFDEEYAESIYLNYISTKKAMDNIRRGEL